MFLDLISNDGELVVKPDCMDAIVDYFVDKQLQALIVLPGVARLLQIYLVNCANFICHSKMFVFDTLSHKHLVALNSRRETVDSTCVNANRKGTVELLGPEGH